jgi:hypothetical protein
MTYVLVFIAYFVLDIVWAWYTKAIAAGHALRAALWAGVIPLLVMSTTILAVDDPWLVLSAAGGGAIGTWVAVR